MFILDYNNYLFEKFFCDSVDKYEKLLDENYSKKTEIKDNYDDQIVEMEKLIVNGKNFIKFLFIFNCRRR